MPSMRGIRRRDAALLKGSGLNPLRIFEKETGTFFAINFKYVDHVKQAATDSIAR